LSKRGINTTRKPITGIKSRKPNWLEQLTYYSKHNYFIPVILFLLCFVLYGNTIRNEYAFDDGLVTYSNEFVVKGFSALKDIFDKGSLYGWDKTNYVQQYRPVTLLSFMAEVSVFGLNPHISHFINILLFALTVVLFYFFLNKIIYQGNNTEYSKRAIIISSALLFAFHPIHTEVVANIKSRDEILSLLFGTLSFYLILLEQESKKNSYSIFSLAAFFVAIFCKESALTFLAIIPLLLYFFTSIEIKKIAVRTLPYVVLVIIYFLIRSRVLKSMTFTSPIGVIENALTSSHNQGDRIATSLMMIGKYIYLLIIPYPLSFDYSYNQIPIVSWSNIEVLLSLMVCLLLAGFMIFGFRKKSIFSFLIAFFFITISLSSNLVVKIAATFAERFLYTPSISLCIALPIVFANTVKLTTLQSPWKQRMIFQVPMVCLLLIYSIITIPRNVIWKNNLSLFSSGVHTSPNSGITHTLLAGLYMETAQGINDSVKKVNDYKLAIVEYKKAIKIYPDYANWYYNLGICYNSIGMTDSAIIAYKKAVCADPGYFLASNNLGVLYLNKTQYDSAIIYLNISLKKDSSLYTLLNISTACQYKKQYNIALHFDSMALGKGPGNVQTQLKLSECYNDIGVECINKNELDKAIEEFQFALQCDSNSVVALGNMGVVYGRLGEIQKARMYYMKALEKDPGNTVIEKNLKMIDTGH
jgi:protein O-mannosyl-transferase